MTLRVRALSDEETHRLVRMARSQKLGAGLVRRARIIQHAVDGLSAPGIAAKMGLCGATVRRASLAHGRLPCGGYSTPPPWHIDAVGGRSLIAAPLSRPSFTSPARVMVLFAVSVGCRNIWSGPEDRHCKVHNGLTLITRPSPRRAIACTLALGRCVLAYLTSFDELRCHGRRGPAERLAGSPDTVQDHGQLARQGDPCLA